MTPLRTTVRQIKSVIIEENICPKDSVFVQWEESLAQKVSQAVKKIGLSVLIGLPSIRLDEAGYVHNFTLRIDISSNPTLDTENNGYDVAYRIFKRLHGYRVKFHDREELLSILLKATDLEAQNATLTTLTLTSQLND